MVSETVENESEEKMKSKVKKLCTLIEIYTIGSLQGEIRLKFEQKMTKIMIIMFGYICKFEKRPNKSGAKIKRPGCSWR